jgi:hypothetical protein
VRLHAGWDVGCCLLLLVHKFNLVTLQASSATQYAPSLSVCSQLAAGQSLDCMVAAPRCRASVSVQFAALVCSFGPQCNDNEVGGMLRVLLLQLAGTSCLRMRLRWRRS